MSKANPPFNMARGAATMTAAPPFDFQNVVLRVFPLRADIHALRLFCDRFLNIAPEFALFEPAAPYVFLEAINYGRMSAEASNFGWVSQNEFAFAVLLNWYRIENGRPVFHDTASVCPFIFVDEETSVRGGREVFGWPKSLARLTPGIDAWARDPRSPRTLFTLSAMVFPELFAGRRQETRVLFEIEQEPPLSAAEFPVDPFNQLNPMVNLPRAVMSSMRMAGDLVENLARLPIRGFPLSGIPMPGASPPRRARNVAGPGFRTAPPWDMVRNAFGNMNPFAQLPAFNTINLKQFRDSERPEEVCYQALVNAKMTTKSVKRGGLLGQQAMALGDPSGGYSLKFHRYKAWPIIESLGLEVASESADESGHVATLKPVLPNWIETDFHYGTGEVLCWRSAYTEWAPAPGEEPARERPSRRRSREEMPARCPEAHPYNSAQGGSLDQVRGPFHFNDVTMRVLPLVADEEKLQAFCDGYLNHRTDEKGLPASGFVETPSGVLESVDKPGRRPGDGLPNNLFRAWGNYVYLIVTSFERMTSELNVGWWARRQVSFAFPVKWYRARGSEWRLVSTALVSPFIYADSSVAATTGREMQGRPVVKADIEAASNAWLNENGPAQPGDLLKLSADVYPALNVGQRIERRELLAITGRDALDRDDEEGWRQVAVSWGETLFSELRSKQGPYDPSAPYLPPCLPSLNGLALEILSGRQPINHVSLKQFRDAEDPARACYQAVTLSPESLNRIYDLREIDDRLHVAIHRYPSQPIVESLGLHVKWQESTGGDVVDYLQPVRPFWLRADLRAHLGRDIFWRAGGSSWNPARWAYEGPPQCMADDDWKGSLADVEEPLLYFERPEPAPFGRFEAQWVDVDPANKRRLQDIGSKLTGRRLRALKQERGGEGTDSETAASGRVQPNDLSEEAQARLDEAHAMNARVAELERPLSLSYAGWPSDDAPTHRPVTPQMALETILSNEWLHFGRPRWEQRKSAEVGDFDRRIRELALAEGSELVEKLEDQRVTARELKEELAKVERGAPPLKGPFVIRQDSIGHPEVRAWFEREYGLERLDDEYWYYVTPEIRGRRQVVRQAIRAAVWQELGEAWSEELGALAPKMEQMRAFDKWPQHLDALERREVEGEINAHLQRFEELRKSLPGLLKSAQSAGEFERSYRDIQTRLQEIRANLQEMTFGLAMLSGETPLDAVDIEQLGPKRLALLKERGINSVEALSRQEARQLAGLLGVGEETALAILEQAREMADFFLMFISGRGEGMAGGAAGGDEDAGREDDDEEDDEAGSEPIPLEPKMIDGLTAERIAVLAEHEVRTVQDLVKPSSKNLHNWLQGIGPKRGAKIIRRAKQILAQTVGS